MSVIIWNIVHPGLNDLRASVVSGYLSCLRPKDPGEWLNTVVNISAKQVPPSYSK